MSNNTILRKTATIKLRLLINLVACLGNGWGNRWKTGMSTGMSKRVVIVHGKVRGEGTPGSPCRISTCGSCDSCHPLTDTQNRQTYSFWLVILLAQPEMLTMWEVPWTEQLTIQTHDYWQSWVLTTAALLVTGSPPAALYQNYTHSVTTRHHHHHHHHHHHREISGAAITINSKSKFKLSDAYI